MKSSFETRPVPGAQSTGFVPADPAPRRRAAPTPKPAPADPIPVQPVIEVTPGDVALEEAAKLRSALDALRTALDQAVQAHADERAQLTSGALEIGFAVAERILQREVSLDPSALLPLVQRAIETLGGAGALTLELSPTDLAAIEDGSAEQLAELGREHSLEFRANPILMPGEARVRNDVSRIDVRLEALLDTIREEIVGEWQEEAG